MAETGLTVEELALVGRIREHGERTGALIRAVVEHYDSVLAKFDTPGSEPSAIDPEEEIEVVAALDWLEDAERTLQKGHMFLMRAVTRPRGF